MHSAIFDWRTYWEPLVSHKLDFCSENQGWLELMLLLHRKENRMSVESPRFETPCVKSKVILKMQSEPFAQTSWSASKTFGCFNDDGDCTQFAIFEPKRYCKPRRLEKGRVRPRSSSVFFTRLEFARHSSFATEKVRWASFQWWKDKAVEHTLIFYI